MGSNDYHILSNMAYLVELIRYVAEPVASLKRASGKERDPIVLEHIREEKPGAKQC
jgi:hypothetical protein